jgi:hypothetical protein
MRLTLWLALGVCSTGCGASPSDVAIRLANSDACNASNEYQGKQYFRTEGGWVDSNGRLAPKVAVTWLDEAALKCGSPVVRPTADRVEN